MERPNILQRGLKLDVRRSTFDHHGHMLICIERVRFKRARLRENEETAAAAVGVAVAQVSLALALA